LDNNWQPIREATKRFNAASPRIFGSVARGEDRPDSDLDILVDALPGSMLLSLGGLLEELEQLLRRTPVHLVTPVDFTEKVRTRVLVEAKPV
jgi:predicted nucleotidyltransferase